MKDGKSVANMTVPVPGPLQSPYQPGATVGCVIARGCRLLVYAGCYGLLFALVSFYVVLLVNLMTGHNPIDRWIPEFSDKQFLLFFAGGAAYGIVFRFLDTPLRNFTSRIPFLRVPGL